MNLLRQAFNRFPHHEIVGASVYVVRANTRLVDDRIEDYAALRAIEVPIIRTMQGLALYFGAHGDPVSLSLRERIART